MKTQELDAVRAIILARLELTDKTMAEVSRAIGKNTAYLQQFLWRGIPRSLPEDVREKIAQEIGVNASTLRGKAPARGGLQTVDLEAIATDENEAALLRLYRTLPDANKSKAIKALELLT